MQAWTTIKSELDSLIEQRKVPPVIAVLPDAPWSERGNYYVDSLHRDGKPVETAFTRDLVAHVDAAYRTAAHRGARLVGGYSMGGAGALGYALRHQDLFAHALVLSPAVYTPLPPQDSSAREFGAYGKGDALFDESVYQNQNYPALLPGLNPDLPVRMFIGVGDDEWAGPEPSHDLDFEAAKLYNTIRRSPAVPAEFRVYNGGHDWSVWQAGFAEGLTHLGKTLSVAPPAGLPQPLYGTSGSDRAGGVAVHPNGELSLAMAVPGEIGALDAQITRLSADRTPLWTKRFGTAANDRLYGVIPLADGGVMAAGYSRGNGPADDMMLARLSANGELLWVKYFGDSSKADRIYGIAPAGDGGAFVTGYTSGAQEGTSAGDKDVILARITPDGERAWVRQFGGTGEDKAFAVAVSSDSVYVAGTLGLTRFGLDGTRDWTVPGTFFGVAVDGSGRAVATGAGIGVSAYTSNGKLAWSATAPEGGTGAEVAALPGGDVAVIGFGDGIFGVPAGGQDIVVLRFDRKGNRTLAAQFGSPKADGADSFNEENLYATVAGDRLWITGLTADTDVFLARVNPSTGLPE
jgi:esterase/lipase superfamily enzyme